MPPKLKATSRTPKRAAPTATAATAAAARTSSSDNTLSAEGSLPSGSGTTGEKDEMAACAQNKRRTSIISDGPVAKHARHENEKTGKATVPLPDVASAPGSARASESARQVPLPALESSTSISYDGFPHIFNSIFGTLLEGCEDDKAGVYSTLLSLRATCKDLRARVDGVLFEHVIVAGRLPKGLLSRYGRLPSMCDDKALGRKRSEYATSIAGHHTRVCDFAGVDSFNSPWLAEVKTSFTRTVEGMKDVSVFRHRDRFDLTYSSLPFSPTKVVRFLDVTKTWHARTDSTDSMALPESVKTLVLNMKYTNDWNKWTEFVDMLSTKAVTHFVFIFDAVDGDEARPHVMPWRFRPFGILHPIMQKLVWELQFNHVLFDITFVGLPDIDVPWTGLRFNLAAKIPLGPNLLDRFRSFLQAEPSLPVDGSALSDDEVEGLFKKVQFKSRDEYAASLSPQEYVEEFLWYAPEEDDGESLL